MDCIQNNIPEMNQPLLQTFRESQITAVNTYCGHLQTEGFTTYRNWPKMQQNNVT